MATCMAFLSLVVYLYCYVPVPKPRFFSTGTDGVTASVMKTGEVTVVPVLCHKEGTHLRWSCRYGAAFSRCTGKVEELRSKLHVCKRGLHQRNKDTKAQIDKIGQCREKLGKVIMDDDEQNIHTSVNIHVEWN